MSKPSLFFRGIQLSTFACVVAIGSITHAMACDDTGLGGPCHDGDPVEVPECIDHSHWVPAQRACVCDGGWHAQGGGCVQDTAPPVGGGTIIGDPGPGPITEPPITTPPGGTPPPAGGGSHRNPAWTSTVMPQDCKAGETYMKGLNSNSVRQGKCVPRNCVNAESGSSKNMETGEFACPSQMKRKARAH